MDFEEACLTAGLPRIDFLALRPAANFKSFTRYLADWGDASRALHALLVLTGMQAEQAACFTFHCCRHVYPTCAFQLLLPPAVVTLIGHWACKADRMACVYDGTR